MKRCFFFCYEFFFLGIIKDVVKACAVWRKVDFRFGRGERQNDQPDESAQQACARD